MTPQLTATITPTGVLTVWGLGGSEVVIDEGAVPAARNALVNLLHQQAAAAGAPVRVAARTPAGPWYLAVAEDGRCIPLDPSQLTVEAPELDPAVVLAGADAVLAAAAASPPQATLALASDPDPAIRARALAELQTWPDDQDAVADAQLPPARLEILSRCALGWVRAGVAANPGTGPDALAGLAADPDRTVRQALAARFDLDPCVTVQLASDPDDRVRAELARNPAATFLRTPAVADAAPPPAAAHPAAAGDATQDAGPAPDPDPDGQPPVRGPRRRARVRRPALAAAVVVAAAAIGVGGYAAATGLQGGGAGGAAAAVEWNGVVLPAGPDGPDDPAGPVAAGFARTELGAAMAAAHLSVRIDPWAGPASFGPTITGQTVGGDPGALLAATRARYEEAAAAAGVSGGGPLPGSGARITGWRTDRWTPEGPAMVHLLVEAPGAAPADYAIAVVWDGGDWALTDPTAPGTFAPSPAADHDSYRSF